MLDGIGLEWLLLTGEIVPVLIAAVIYCITLKTRYAKPLTIAWFVVSVILFLASLPLALFLGAMSTDSAEGSGIPEFLWGASFIITAPTIIMVMGIVALIMILKRGKESEVSPVSDNETSVGEGIEERN